VLKTDGTFARYCRRLVGNGQIALFWDDLRIGNKPIRKKISRLYFLTFSVNIKVAKFFTEGWGCIRFKRVYMGKLLGFG
jgi:hypothetical protein